MKWLYRIFRLFKCPHKTKVIAQADVYESHDIQGKLPEGRKYTLQCSRCGDIFMRKAY